MAEKSVENMFSATTNDHFFNIFKMTKKYQMDER